MTPTEGSLIKVQMNPHQLFEFRETSQAYARRRRADVLGQQSKIVLLPAICTEGNELNRGGHQGLHGTHRIRHAQGQREHQSEKKRITQGLS